MTERSAASRIEDEQEVDLASAWRRLQDRWWLPVGGLVAGAILGIALALSGGSVWRAEAIVYLGQPFAPLGGGQIQSLATNPRTVSEIVRSEAVLRDVSRAARIPVAKLRASISTREITAVGQARGINPLIEIALKGSARGRVEQATDALAARVVADVSEYVIDKTRQLQERVTQLETQLEEVNERIRSAQEQQAAVLESRSLPLDQALLVTANLNSVITTADARRAAILDDLFESRQLLNLAEQVESSRVVEPATAVRTTARSSRTSLLVGALIGLLVGTIVALAVEPIVARRRGRAPSPS